MNTEQWLQKITSIRLPLLAAGSHRTPEAGLCAMEMVAFMERLPHNDSPPCTCRVLTRYVQTLNDALYNPERQRLLPYLPRLVGTNDGMSLQRELELQRCFGYFSPLTAWFAEPVGNFTNAAMSSLSREFPQWAYLPWAWQTLEAMLAIRAEPERGFTHPEQVEELCTL